MKSRLFAITALLLAFTSSAQASTVLFNGSSLQGSTGSLTIVQTSATHLNVTWALDTSTFVGDGNHDYLTHAGFKIAGTSGTATFMSASPTNITGTVFGTNVSNHGCASGSSSQFICLAVDAPFFNAVTEDLLELNFSYTLDSAFSLVSGTGVSFAGKYGEGNGWVISEGGSFTTTVPAPGVLSILGLGMLVFGVRRRKLVG